MGANIRFHSFMTIRIQLLSVMSQVDTQRRYFQPWQPGQALFLDGLNSVEDNFAAAMAFISDPNIRLTG